MKRVAICLVAFAACTPKTETIEEPGAMAAASSDPCCTVLAAAKGTNSVLTNTIAKCMFIGATVASCQWPVKPPPGPDAGSGGSAPVATGGSSSIGGGVATGGASGTNPGNLAHCIADLAADPAIANVASKQGMTAKALATKECADPNVLRRHP